MLRCSMDSRQIFSKLISFCEQLIAVCVLTMAIVGPMINHGSNQATSQLRIETMDKNTHIGQIAIIEAQIKDLTKERDALRIQAVVEGYATWSVTIRMSAPSLSWWKENRPTVWQKYAKQSTVKKFTVA